MVPSYSSAVDRDEVSSSGMFEQSKKEPKEERRVEKKEVSRIKIKKCRNVQLKNRLFFIKELKKITLTE